MRPKTNESSVQVKGLDLELRRAVKPVRKILTEDMLGILRLLAALTIGSHTQRAYVHMWLAMLHRGVGKTADVNGLLDEATRIAPGVRASYLFVTPQEAMPRRDPMRKGSLVDEEAVEALYRLHFPDRNPAELDIIDKALALPVSVPRLR